MMKLLTALAGEILPAAGKVKGINESVTIQNFGSNWGYTYEMTGFYMGTARVDVVPVTREAAAVLQSLNKKSRYNCVIEYSTYVSEDKGRESVGGIYYVLDINCD